MGAAPADSPVNMRLCCGDMSHIVTLIGRDMNVMNPRLKSAHIATGN